MPEEGSRRLNLLSLSYAAAAIDHKQIFKSFAINDLEKVARGRQRAILGMPVLGGQVEPAAFATAKWNAYGDKNPFSGQLL